jgi:hypothetical protein
MRLSKPIEITEEFEGAKFVIRQLTAGEKMERSDVAFESHIEIVTDENGKRDVRRTVEPNAARERAFVIDKAVVGWSGVYDAEGNELECTAENKSLVLNAVDGFYEFVGIKVAELDEVARKQAEAAEKNF